MFRICWKHLLTHAEGCGEPCLNEEQAIAWVIKLNAENSEIYHWIERLVTE